MHAASGFAPPSESTLKRLFFVQENVILLGGAVLFALALASPVPLLLGAAGELLWLAFGSMSPGVRRWLERRGAAARAVTPSSPEDAGPARVSTGALAPEYARRVLTLERALATLRGFGGARPQPPFERAMARLAALTPLYAAFCETHRRIGRFVVGTSEGHLLAEAERLKAQFAAEKDLGTRLTLRQAIGAAQRHVAHRREMVELQRSVAVKLESVERSLAYLVSQGPALVSNPNLPAEVEALLAELGPSLDVDVEGRRESAAGPASM